MTDCSSQERGGITLLSGTLIPFRAEPSDSLIPEIKRYEGESYIRIKELRNEARKSCGKVVERDRTTSRLGGDINI
jgi:hypothetical protein